MMKGVGVLALTLIAIGGAAADDDKPAVADDAKDAEEAIVEPRPGVQDKVTHADSGHGDQHPLDVPDEAGLFIYSADGRKAVRVYGSGRVRAVLDDRQNFHPFDLNLPQVPTGEDDFEDLNSAWSVKESRIGLDALVARGEHGGALLRMEFDWKGTDEALRIRHLFFRTKHWLFGKAWATVSNVPVLPQAVDGHLVSAGLGSRPVQVRYYNRAGSLQYRVALEYSPPKLIKPDSLEAEGRVVIPKLAGRLTFENEMATLLLAGEVRPNRVQFTGESKEAQTLTGYGGVFAGKISFDKSNRLKFSANANLGTAGGMADFAFTNIDLIYDPATGEFENTEVYGGYLAYEHNWSKTLSSTIGIGYIDVRNKSFEPDLAFSRGYKPVVNLFFRPTKRSLKGLTVAAEVEYAHRTNVDNSKSRTTRVELLMYYDF